MLSRPQKDTFLAGKRVLAYTYRSRNAIWARGEESKKERKKEKKHGKFEKSHHVTSHMRSHIFAQTTHVVLFPPKMSYGVINHAKFYQSRFRGYGFMMGQNLPFFYA